MVLSVTTIKLLTALVIFVCGLVSTIVPLFVVGTNEAIFSAGNMMASGVLLAAGLTHMLPDSTSSLNDEDGYPWSFLICGLTFILFLIFEESVHLLVGGHSHDHSESITQLEGLRESRLVHGSSCRGSIVIPGLEQIIELSNEDYGSIQSHSHSHSHGHGHDHSDGDETEPLKMRRASRIAAAASAHRGSMIFGDPNRQSVAGVHHHHDDHIAEHLHGSFLASLVLLAALSVHSILAGLSIGLVPDVSAILSTAVAIVAHKVFAGYALGSTMVAADLGWDRHVPLSVAFSFSTPLGIFIGMFLASDSYDEGSASVGIVQAVVAGTFLYVAIIEVGMKELLICRHDDHDGPATITLSEKHMEALKLVSLLVGFLGMSWLAAYV